MSLPDILLIVWHDLWSVTSAALVSFEWPICCLGFPNAQRRVNFSSYCYIIILQPGYNSSGISFDVVNSVSISQYQKHGRYKVMIGINVWRTMIPDHIFSSSIIYRSSTKKEEREGPAPQFPTAIEISAQLIPCSIPS